MYNNLSEENINKFFEDNKEFLPSIEQVSENYFIADSGKCENRRHFVVGMNRKGLEELHKKLQEEIKKYGTK